MHKPENILHVRCGRKKNAISLEHATGQPECNADFGALAS
jgi:hypothetical protein